MKFQLWNSIFVIFFIFRQFCHGGIICSQCHLADYSRCEEQPPAAEPCFDPGNGILQTCSIIRIFRNSTGELIDFRRSCATTHESGCYRDLDGNRVCAEICFTDHCNAPHAACTRHLLQPTLITAAALLGLWLRR